MSKKFKLTPTQMLIETPKIMRDPLGWMVGATAKHGDVVVCDVNSFRVYVASDPAWIEHVLVKNARNYSKATVQFETFSAVTGNGLLNSDGDFWLSQRRLAQPAFHRKLLDGMAGTMVKSAVHTAHKWRRMVGQTVDMEHEMLLLSLPVICEALFGEDVRGRAEQLVLDVTHALDQVMFRAQLPFNFAAKLPLPVNRKFARSMGALDAWVEGMIEARRRGDLAHDSDDLLGMLVAADLPTPVIRDEVMTMIVAGYETVASGLTWTWYLLDKHPRVAVRLRHELAQVLNGQTPTLDDLPHLPYLKMVVDESFRLFPPSWLVSRRAEGADEIGGVTIPERSMVVISPWVVHRNARLWDAPERFSPERFAAENKPSIRKYTYIPFGSGQRMCIGNHFALLETQLVLAALAQQFKPEIAQKEPKVLGMVTVRPKNGLKMRLR